MGQKKIYILIIPHEFLFVISILITIIHLIQKVKIKYYGLLSAVTDFSFSNCNYWKGVSKIWNVSGSNFHLHSKKKGREEGRKKGRGKEGRKENKFKNFH